jgi:ABC-2 type transport system permease protein
MISGKRIFADFKNFSRGYLRNKFGLFFGLIFPVVLILIFGAIFSGGSSGQVTVYVQNQDVGPFAVPQMDVAKQFINTLNGTMPDGSKISDWPIYISQVVDASENFTSFLASKSASDGIIIPANFSANYLAGHAVNVTIYRNPTSSTSGSVLGAVGGVINNYNLRYYNPTAQPIIGFSTATVNAAQTSYIDFLVPGLIGFSILVNPMFSLVNISSDYKKNKLFKQLSLTPLTKMEWLISKIMWYIVLSALSFLLMVGVGILAFGAHITLTVWLIPFMILGPMMFASLGMLVGTVTKNPETAGVIGNIVTFPMMFLAGTFFPISAMPQYLQTVAHVLPLFYIVEGLNNVMVYGNITSALIDIAVVLAITAVIFAAAVKLFKWRED